ncbi:MAG: hypothetical protein RL548_1265, partial [Bacteroidota bacterium]
MFTGIVSEGFIKSILPDELGWELVIDAAKFASIVQIGDSVAIDGACLSVTKIEGNYLSFFVSTESIDKTIICHYKVGSKKKSMTWSASVDQALCYGWIDGVRKSIDEESYCIRFTPRKASSIWSAVNIKKVEMLIQQNLMQAAGLEIYD